MLKEAFPEAAHLFGDFKNEAEIMVAVKEIQLSRNTVTWGFEDIAGNLEDQSKKDVDC